MMIEGQETIADVFGVAPKTIVEWQEQGFPVAVRGGPGVASQYDSAACIRWLVEREVRKAAAPESSKDRLHRVQAERIEMELARERGQLVPADAIEPLWRSAVLNAREFLRGEPMRLAALLIGKDRDAMEQTLREAFDEFLRRLANWRADPEDELDEDAGDLDEEVIEG